MRFAQAPLWNLLAAPLVVVCSSPGRPVPRFYFDIREGTRFIPDNEGLEFDSLDAAEREAAEAAAQIGRDKLPKGGTRDITIEVRNEHGQRVLTVAISMHIDRVAPPPTAPGGLTPLDTAQAGLSGATKLFE